MGVAKSASNDKPLRTMGYKVLGGILFVRHRSLAVADPDWQDMLGEIERNLQRDQPLPILVKTDDAGPNALQRNLMNQLVQSKGATLRVAVMSNSRLVRGIVTAFSWMGTMQIRSMEPHDYQGALAFLRATQVSPADAARVFAEIESDVG
jgi:hypothetical protein